MKSSENYKKILINIRTYKVNKLQTIREDEYPGKMDEDRKKHKTNLNNKFICSICLNCKKNDRSAENEKKITKALIQKSCDICLESTKAQLRDENRINNNNLLSTDNKAVQTSYTDLNKSLNLLNEVLTVFQNKKQLEVQPKSKTVILKDASISTEDVRALKPKLGISKVFQFSVDEIVDKNDKTIITSHEDFVRSQQLIELPKHKSSSVPQMKLEELKNSIKQKTKPKDTIDEVNRMFATVRKVARRKLPEELNLNRPLIRNGPRILPVVKTNDLIKTVKPSESDELSCKFCQTRVDCMSSGDSFIRPEFCRHASNQKCDKCVYVMCCNYKNYHKMQAGVMFCDRCHGKKNFRCKHSRDNSFDDND